MFVSPNNSCLQYSGRIDFDNPEVPEFVYPCSFVRMRFQGTSLKVTVENHKNYWSCYLGYILDGKQDKIKLPDAGKTTITLAEGLEDTEHDLLFFKRMDSCHTFQFYGFELSEGAKLFPVEAKPVRRIEVYGDSVSAGEVSEAIEYVGKPDPEHDGEYSNSYYSYSWMTARKLHAEIHDIAQGGAALLHNTGWFSAPEYVGMEDIYDKIQYNPQLGPSKKWDFAKYRPHVVIVAIGQNDSHPEDYMAEDYEGAKACHWRAEYKDFLRKLRELYPNATIVLTTTILNHHANWDRAIDQVCMEMQDNKVHHFLYSKNGIGTPGHIRIPEAEQMSDELTAFITSLGEEIWMDA
ncbi:MAG: GDSL-type esterase/lipase family protein [Lachnospiraceae bacterium]|nr:GDSL-type esterase/lipase family protein [Lachnospiraceae bacterium]